MSITSKPTYTRTQRRTVLRLMLRDPNSSVWSDAVLNYCLDEGLILVQALFPLVKVTSITVTSSRVYSLPVECLMVERVEAVSPSGTTAGTDPDPVDASGLTGVALSGTTWSVAGNQYARVLVLNEFRDPGETLLVWYRAVQQPWGDPSDTGLDSTVKDLAPTALQDGRASLLLYAGARAAAYRYAAQIVPGGSGPEYENLLKIALAERDDLIRQLGGLKPLTLRGALFA